MNRKQSDKQFFSSLLSKLVFLYHLLTAGLLMSRRGGEQWRLCQNGPYHASLTSVQWGHQIPWDLLTSEATVSHRAVKVFHRYRECILAGAAPVLVPWRHHTPHSFPPRLSVEDIWTPSSFTAPGSFAAQLLMNNLFSPGRFPSGFSGALQEATQTQCATHSGPAHLWFPSFSSNMGIFLQFLWYGCIMPMPICPL